MEKVIELEGNEKLQRFIQLLCELNHQTVATLKTGNTEYLFAMNDTIEEMYSIQHDSKEEEYTEIEDDAQVIYKNFNAIIAMINSNEKDGFDQATAGAVKVFLHNIFEAIVNIVRTYGLAE